MSDDKGRLWKAFRTGFLESAEGWNGETYHGNVDAYERRLRPRFEALHESGKFDEPYDWESDGCDHEFDDWIPVGLGPENERRYYSRRCTKCDYRESEWRPIGQDADGPASQD